MNLRERMQQKLLDAEQSSWFRRFDAWVSARLPNWAIRFGVVIAYTFAVWTPLALMAVFVTLDWDYFWTWWTRMWLYIWFLVFWVASGDAT